MAVATAALELCRGTSPLAGQVRFHLDAKEAAATLCPKYGGKGMGRAHLPALFAEPMLTQ